MLFDSHHHQTLCTVNLLTQPEMTDNSPHKRNITIFVSGDVTDPENVHFNTPWEQ